MSKKEIISNIIMALCELGIGVLLLVDPLGFTSMIFIALGSSWETRSPLLRRSGCLSQFP